jgi:protein-disulfide isomerase
MKGYLARILVLLVGLLGLFLFSLAFIDFSYLGRSTNDQAMRQGDYLRFQSDYKNLLSLRDLGDPNAELKFTLYTDFACEGCRVFYEQLSSWLKFYLIDDKIAEFRFRFYPLINVHKESIIASQATLCAAEQGDFYTFHNLLLERQADWLLNVNIVDYLTDMARLYRYDAEEFRKCLSTNHYEEFVKLELNDAISRGITGAPTVILEYKGKKRVIEGALNVSKYEQEIDSLKKEGRETE